MQDTAVHEALTEPNLDSSSDWPTQVSDPEQPTYLLADELDYPTRAAG